MYDIELVLDEMEIELMQNMKKTLEKGIDKDVVAWQKQQLDNIEKFRQKNKKIIKEYKRAIAKGSAKDLRELYKKQCAREYNRISKKNKNLILDVDSDAFKALSDDRLVMLLQEVLDFETKAMTAAYRSVDDIYRQIIFKSTVLCNTREYTLVDSIDAAQQDFLKKGITNIMYASGAIVPIRSYCEMALKTNRTRTALNARGLVREQLGLYLVRVSYHQSSCPKCGKFENKIAFDNVNEQGGVNNTQYPNLSDFVEKGLFHPNCRHITYWYDEDDSEKDNIPENLKYTKEDVKRYKAEQHQRKLERDIRKYKRLETGMLNDSSQYKQKRINKEKELEEFLATHEKLKRKEWRERLE